MERQPGERNGRQRHDEVFLVDAENPTGYSQVLDELGNMSQRLTLSDRNSATGS
jgi:hypothetical protein